MDGMVLESDEPITYEDDNTTIRATKNASLRGNDFLLFADHISWNRKSGEAFAAGSVSLTRGNSRILSDELRLSTSTGDFTAQNCRGGEPPTFFIAKSIERNSSVETYLDAQVYMSEPGFLEPNFRTSRYSVDDNLSTFSIAAPQFRLGDFLIGILPGYSGKKRSGLFLDPVIKTGKDSSLGWFGETSLNHSWNDLTTSTKLTYYLDRGFFISPVFSYNKSYDDGFFNSTVTGGWINDQADRLSADARNYPLERNRGYSHFSSTSRHKDRLRSSTLIEWESDSEIIRDFKRSQFYGNQWNQSHNEFSYEGDGYTISILTRWQANNHEAIVEQLPLLNLDFGPSKLGDTKLFQSTSLNYANLYNRNQFGETLYSTRRMSLGHKVERPISLSDGLRLIPSFSLLNQDYQLNDTSENRSFYCYGADLHAAMHQVLPYTNQVWEFDYILHLMKLSLGFRVTETLNVSNRENIPKIYPIVEDLNLSPLDLLDHRNSEEVSQKDQIRIGWESVFLTKWNQKSRKIFSMRTYYDMINHAPDREINGNFIYSDIAIHPSYWIGLNLRNKFDTKSGDNFRKSYSLSLYDGRFQGVSLGYLSYLNFNNYSSFYGWKRLNEKLYSSTSALYDLDASYLTYLSGRLEYRAGSSWVWDFSITQRKGTRKENNLEWTLGLSLGGFKLNRLAEPEGLSSLYSM